MSDVDRSNHCWLAKAALAILALTCLVLGPARSAAAAETNKTPKLPSQRYLLIVETSRAMRGRMDNVIPIIRDLLASGMQGEVRAGDSLGIWTFNDELHTGQVPAQNFAPASRQMVAARTIEFLKGQKCKSTARIEKVFPAIRDVVQASELITVILVSCGEEDLQLSRFDTEINQAYGTWRGQQAKARMPFIATMRGYFGKIQAGKVTVAPFPVELPDLPVASLFAKKVESPTSQSKTQAPPPAMGPPLIVRGSRAKTSPAAIVTAAPATNAALDIQTAPALAASANNTEAAVPPSKPAQPLATSPGVSAAPEPKPQPAAAVQPAAGAPAVEPASAPADSGKPAAELSVAATQPPGAHPGEALVSHGGGAGPKPSSAVVAAAGPVDLGLPRWPLLSAGALLILCLAGFWWWRRSRPRAHISLITQSLDREQR